MTEPTATALGAPRGGVQSIDRAVAILRCFDARRPDLGISDIARITGLSTSTAHRLLASMQSNRLVRQTTDRRYALGPLLVQLARNGGLPTTLRDAALPAMRQLRERADETVGLHELLATGERAVIEQVESRQPLRRTYTEFGVPLPLPHGSPGKAMLAFRPVAIQEAVLAVPLEAATQTTITDPAVLRHQLVTIRSRGYAMSLAERTPGIRTVAAPIFDHTGDVIGCLSLSAPEMRIPVDRMEELGELVRVTAWSVSEVLGATPGRVSRCTAAAGVLS